MANRTRVVLDPGHGGSVGIGGSSPNNATGPSPRSLKEKDLTLRLSALVEERLRESCDVMLTRNSDRNLALADRAAVARADHADLFLSIHFNGFADASVDGTEVWVAANASPRSRSFAQTVLNRLVLVTGVANRNVRERNLGVLLASRHDAGTAACLAEIAFLTNARQAARLEEPEYLAQIADALAGAVRAQAVAVVAQAAAAGNGRGHGHRTPDRLPHAALARTGSDRRPALRDVRRRARARTAVCPAAGVDGAHGHRRRLAPAARVLPRLPPWARTRSRGSRA